MAITRSDRVYSGTLSTTATTMTIGASTTFIMQGFCISNANASDRKAELKIDSKRIFPYVKTIPTGDAIIQSGLNIPITTGKIISVKGEVASDMDYYIWGVDEVTS